MAELVGSDQYIIHHWTG